MKAWIVERRHIDGTWRFAGRYDAATWFDAREQHVSEMAPDFGPDPSSAYAADLRCTEVSPLNRVP